MTQESAVRTSKYIKPAREEKIFEKTVVFFLFSLFVMPQYFGLPTPLFDFTLLRMMLILVLFMIIYDDERKVAFADLILHSRLTLVLLPYMFVLLYTMVLRADINAFLNPFLEILSFYLLIYVIHNGEDCPVSVGLPLSDDDTWSRGICNGTFTLLLSGDNKGHLYRKIYQVR